MANIALVFLLGIVFESAGDLNFSQMLDFIIDSTVSLVFTSAGCYSFVTMARGSLGRILSEADRILTAVDEQKTAFDEISRNISYINQRAGNRAWLHRAVRDLQGDRRRGSGTGDAFG